jgi:hypothetical protein
MRTRATGIALGGILVLTGCGTADGEPATAADTPAYREVVDVAQLMAWILEPAADVIWDSAGVVITIDGEQDLAPTDEQGWVAVRDAAALVAESGNLLMMPGRARDADAWAGYARSMIDMGRRAMAAADARDADELFDAGGALYTVCVGCHRQYWMVDPLRLAP